jgi:hypothetical protein
MLQHIIAMFVKINNECMASGDQVVPLTADNIDYYIEQMENLEYSDKAIHLFEEYLKTQH